MRKRGCQPRSSASPLRGTVGGGLSEPRGLPEMEEVGGGGMAPGERKGMGAASWSQALPRTEHLLCSQRRRPAKLVNKGKRPEGRQLSDKAGDCEQLSKGA